MKLKKLVKCSLAIALIFGSAITTAACNSDTDYAKWAKENGYIKESEIDYGKYITDNNYHSDTEYITHGNSKYQEGVNSVDITTDNEESYNEGFSDGVDSTVFVKHGSTIPSHFKETEITVIPSEMGTYKQFAYTSTYENDYIVYIAEPKEGYYFKYWKITENDTDEKIKYDSIIDVSKYYATNYAYKVEKIKLEAVYTEEEIVYAPLNVNVIDKKEDMPAVHVSLVDINHFSLSGGVFIEGSKNYYIESLNYTVQVTGEMGNIIQSKKFSKTPYKHIASYSSWVDEDEIENLESITFNIKFIDTNEKSIVNVYRLHKSDNYQNSASLIPSETYVFNRGSIQTIVADHRSWGDEYLHAWYDENGEVLSYGKSLDLYANEGEINVYYEYIKSDYTYEYNPTDEDKQQDRANYEFSLNEDDTLTLESIGNCSSNCSGIVIPEYVDGKKVTRIADHAFMDHTYDITIPSYVEEIDVNAFILNGWISELTIEGDRNDLTFEMFKNVTWLSVSTQTLENMIHNEVRKFIKDVNLNVTYYDENDSHYQGGTLGYYTAGSRSINVFYKAGEALYHTSRNVIVHEIRHFYQEIAIDNVEGLSLEDLIIKPTKAQVGAWKYLDYADSSSEPNKYKYNAREIDAREYAYKVTDFDLYEEIE